MRWTIRDASGSREVDVVRTGGGFDVNVGGQRHRVDLICMDGSEGSLRFSDDHRSFYFTFERTDRSLWRLGLCEREFEFSVLTPLEAQEGAAAQERGGPSRIEAPIPGKVIAVKVSQGDEVQVGQSLVVLEAMKMENELAAEQAGKVVKVHVEPGATVATGSLLVELE